MYASGAWTSFTPESFAYLTLASLATPTTSNIAQHTVQVTATLAAGNGDAAITNFRCYTSTAFADSYNEASVVSSGSSTLSVTMATTDGSTELARYTQYKWFCQAENGAGWSVAARTAVIRTLPDPPAAPSAPGIGSTQATQFVASWSAPLDSATAGGNPSSEYTYTLLVESGGSTVANQMLPPDSTRRV